MVFFTSQKSKRWPAWLLAGILFFPATATAFELHTLYAIVEYSDPELLREMNDQLYLGRSLRYRMKNWPSDTVEDEVKNKINLLVDRVQAILQMRPDNLRFKIVLLPDEKAVQQVYFSKYGKEADHIAYYSLSEKTIYLAVNHATLKVLSHELGHVVVDHYFKVRPPYNLHEVMAQYVEQHITD